MKATPFVCQGHGNCRQVPIVHISLGAFPERPDYGGVWLCETHRDRLYDEVAAARALARLNPAFKGTPRVRH